MKTLCLIRHSESDWGSEGITDVDRPLNIKGYTYAHTISKRVKERNISPESIVTSPAI